MTLVEEAIKSDEHVTMNRVTHFLHLVSVTVPLRFSVALWSLHAHLTQVIYGLSFITFENIEESLKLRLSLLAEIYGGPFYIDHLT